MSLALYSLSSWCGVVGENLRLSTSKKINNPGFEFILPRPHHRDKFKKNRGAWTTKKWLPRHFLFSEIIPKPYYPGLYYCGHIALADGMKNRYIWSIIDIWGTHFFQEHRWLSVWIKWLSRASMSFVIPRIQYNIEIPSIPWRWGSIVLFWRNASDKSFLASQKMLWISSCISLNTFTFWSSHLNLLRIHVISLWIFHTSMLAWSFTHWESWIAWHMHIFSKIISAKIYPNKVAALEHCDDDILVLKRLKCNAKNDLARFICVEALSQPK